MTQNKNILACDNRDFLINNCFVCSRQLVQALLGLILVQDNLFFGSYCCFFRTYFEKLVSISITNHCEMLTK